ncbi:hypothetical protein C6B38_00445 [Spiroplasma sp. ChiS]|uniref:Mbov_0396 family ICE element transmembrane protein n=1 Tax=Spiroplasma sp. ChiS TaxID=2099885 RepID=UPI000CFA3316|nr:hypothetical protein [Spiroplasma sp. ChiS]PQP79717.1 hypothetical protein C6B38_00445 [Spiroplasma sp. ChiS]
MILNALYKLIWSVFVQGPLQLIASFNTVLNYLTGGVVGDLMFRSKQEFSFQNIPMALWYFVITALCLFSLIFTITIIKILFQDATETKTKFIVALQNGSKAFVFIFLIPIFFFLANFAIANIAKIITSGFGGENGNIANYLYNIGNTNWDGGDNITSNYSYPDNIRDFNMIAEVFGVWFMLFAMFMIGIALVQKIIELFFLFIISPWVMVIMTIDNGKGAFIWKDMVIAKFLASTATFTGYFIFMTTIQTILSTNLAGLGIEGIGKSLFVILFMCGGGLAVMAFSDVVANLIGEAAGVREGIISMKSTVAGGMMAMGVGKIAGKAFGFAKSKRAKRAMAMGGTTMADKTMNAMGSGGDGDWGDNETARSQSRQEKPLDFRHFWHATEGMSSRAGIVGLAGFGLGLTTLATSKLVGAARGGGTKGFFRQIGIGVATPFKAIGKRFNPQLANSGNETNNFKTTKSSDWKSESLNKKLGKVENKFTSKNSFSYLKATTKKEMKHNKKVRKQGNIVNIINKFNKKSNARQKKWDEKAAKKAEKKKS